MSMTKSEFLAHARVEVQILDVWIEQRWLRPEGKPAGQSFSDMDLARARLIQDLRGDFGVNDEGVDVILHLVDQLHGLRQALAELHRGLPGSPGEPVR